MILIEFDQSYSHCHLIWLPSWSVLQTSRPIRGLGDTGSSVGCGTMIIILIEIVMTTMLVMMMIAMFLKINLTHLRF